MKRTERILQDKKQNKISVKNGKPSSIDLKENELTIRNTEEGLFFYIKYNGAVYSRKLNKIDKSTNRLYLKEVVSTNRDTDKDFKMYGMIPLLLRKLTNLIKRLIYRDHMKTFLNLETKDSVLERRLCRIKCL